MHPQEFVHLLQLQLVVGEQYQNALLASDRAFAALEVEAGCDLARHSGDSVINLGKVDPRNNVKARHGHLLRGIVLDSDIARRWAKISGRQSSPGRFAKTPAVPSQIVDSLEPAYKPHHRA